MKKELSIVCVLFDPGPHRGVPRYCRTTGYSPLWVDRLYRGFYRNLSRPFRFICLTHYPSSAFEEDVEAVPFINDTRDWWCINEILRPDLGIERAVVCGLDTLILGPIDDMVDHPHPLLFCMNNMRAGHIINGFCIWDQTAVTPLWDKLQRQDAEMRAKHRLKNMPAEMMLWNEEFADRAALFNEEFPHRVVDWKREWRNGVFMPKARTRTPLDRSKVSVVFFYGKVKQHVLPPGDPLLEHWK